MPKSHIFPRFACLSLLAGLFASAPAIARDDAPRAIGGWTVAPSKDGQGCFLTKVYDRPGDTTLLLGLDRDGTNHLTVLNSNWSIEPKQRLKLDFRLSKGGYAKHFAVGLASDGKRGFVTSFEPKFPAYFASSHMLAIARGDVPVERLPSTAAALRSPACGNASPNWPIGRGCRAVKNRGQTIFRAIPLRPDRDESRAGDPKS